MVWRVSGGIVSGSWAVGTFGAKSSRANTMKLITSSVGIENNRRRAAYLSMDLPRALDGPGDGPRHFRRCHSWMFHTVASQALCRTPPSDNVLAATSPRCTNGINAP